jgi:heme/copper-type cytochrome/quinol oxidase subunit 3
MKDVTVEATYLGDHTDAVQHGLIIGFILFVINEALFFAGFF